MKTLTWRINGSDPSSPRFRLADAMVPVSLRLVADRAVGAGISVDVMADGVSILNSMKATIAYGLETGEGEFSPSLAFIAPDALMSVSVTDRGDGTPFTVELDLESD